MTAAATATALAVPAAEFASATRDTRPLRLITCGSVDDGKSTLIGRLLWDTKAVKEDQAATLRRDSTGKQNDLGLPDFALLLDGLQAEREQGITIDVAYRYFSTDKRSFIVADTPGHEQYTRNMATGASTADLAVLLIDARAGHSRADPPPCDDRLASRHQAVRACDQQDRPDELRPRRLREDHPRIQGIRAFARRQADHGDPDVGAEGRERRLFGPGRDALVHGPTLVETLEMATVRSSQTVGFRLSVQRVSRPGESFRGYQGTVAGGAVKPGDSVVILPSGNVANVSKIVTFDLVRNAAVAGDAITLVLDRQVDVARGDMIVSIDSQPQVGLAFDAQLVALQPEGIEPGKRYWLKSGSRRQRVEVQPVSQLELKSGAWNPAERLPMNAIGKVHLAFDQAAVFDPYEQNRSSGSFILIDPETNNTVAGGMITGKRTDVSGLHSEEARVVLSLPADLAEQIMASAVFVNRRDEADVRRMTSAQAAELWANAASDI